MTSLIPTVHYILKKAKGYHIRELKTRKNRSKAFFNGILCWCARSECKKIGANGRKCSAKIISLFEVFFLNRSNFGNKKKKKKILTSFHWFIFFSGMCQNCKYYMVYYVSSTNAWSRNIMHEMSKRGSDFSQPWNMLNIQALYQHVRK